MVHLRIAWPGKPARNWIPLAPGYVELDALVVPYKGIAPALQDVVAGQLKGMFVGVSVADAYIKEGTLRVLGVTSPRRLTASPDAPTIAEQGLPGI